MWPYWNKCGLVDGTVLFEAGLEVSYAQAMPFVAYSLPLPPAVQDGELLGPSRHHVCLHAAMHHGDNGLNP